MTTETARAFYRRQGWNPGYGHKVKSQGRLVTVNEGGKELVDVEASIARMAATSDPSKAHMAQVNEAQRNIHRGTTTPPPLVQTSSYQPGTESSKNATYMQAKTAREVYDAKMSQLEYERESGKLVKKRDVDSAVFEISRALRDGLTNCARRIAADVAGIDNAPACETVVDREHRALLENMVKQFGALLNANQEEATA